MAWWLGGCASVQGVAIIYRSEAEACPFSQLRKKVRVSKNKIRDPVRLVIFELFKL
jgi:hypothetical protein